MRVCWKPESVRRNPGPAWYIWRIEVADARRAPALGGARAYTGNVCARQWTGSGYGSKQHDCLAATSRTRNAIAERNSCGAQINGQSHAHAQADEYWRSIAAACALG